MAGLTNRGKKLLLEYAFGRSPRPSYFYVALCSNAVTPGPQTNTLGDLSQIVSGNGYPDGGYQLAPGSLDFDVSGENDAGGYGFIQLKDLVWTASGGPLPASGNGARWAVLTDDQAPVAERQVIAYWDLLEDRTLSPGQSLTLKDCEVRITED